MSPSRHLTEPEFNRLVDEMQRAHREGELGAYVSGLVQRVLVTRMSTPTAELVTPCLPYLAKAVDMACPIALRSTPEGLGGQYGIFGVRPGDVFVVIANPRNSVGVGFELPTEDPPQMLPGVSSAAFWCMVAETIDAVNGPEDTTGHANLLLAAVLAKFGPGIHQFRDTARKLRLSSLPCVMAIAGVAGNHGNRAGGGLITLPLPLILVEEEVAGHA